jgi:hypothetical protein
MFLSELREHVEVNIESSNIFGREFCQKNNHFLWKKPSFVVFHRCLIDFSGRISSTHFGNITLVDHNLVRIMWTQLITYYLLKNGMVE